MNFDVIQHEQTPETPQIDNITLFIEVNKEIIDSFKEYAMSKPNAIGLAANQCSLDGARLNLRMIAIKCIGTFDCVIAIDPKITKYYGVKRQRGEGCLTWGPKAGKYFGVIAYRHHFVDVEYYTPDGVFHKETYKGFQAQVWQHEVNHINGVAEHVISEDILLEEPIDKKTERNDKCPCGSGLKYKKCCMED